MEVCQKHGFGREDDSGEDESSEVDPLGKGRGNEDTDMLARHGGVSASGIELPHVTQWPKITGILTAASEELDEPLYLMLPHICGAMGISCMTQRLMRGALLKLGAAHDGSSNADWLASHFHREPNAIKTSAPVDAVFDIVRWWAQREKGAGGIKEEVEEVADKISAKERKRRAKQARRQEAAAGPADSPDAEGALAQKEPPSVLTHTLRSKTVDARVLEVLGDDIAAVERVYDAFLAERQQAYTARRVARFVPNPANWGPKARARGAAFTAPEASDAVPGAEASGEEPQKKVRME